MIEALMCVSLAAMGFYFLKSTDLPKEMQERSNQLRAEAAHNPISRTKKMNLSTTDLATQKINLKNSIKVLDDNQLNRLVQLEARKKELEIKQRAQVIDELTLKITNLEQELKTNNDRIEEIMAEIDSHMTTLARLTSVSLT